MEFHPILGSSSNFPISNYLYLQSFILRLFCQVECVCSNVFRFIEGTMLIVFDGMYANLDWFFDHGENEALDPFFMGMYQTRMRF